MALRRQKTMRHSVAYHKVHEHGPFRTGTGTFRHWSSCSQGRLDKTIGERVWVIAGDTRPRPTTYHLIGFFSPEKIEKRGEEYVVRGAGVPFDPAIPLHGKAWLPRLLDDQSNFSLGMDHQIKDRAVLRHLLALERKCRDLTRRPIRVPGSRGAADRRAASGGGFGQPEKNREVERAAIESARYWYRSQGWRVRDVQSERCGFDLVCTRGRQCLDVEVKGVTGTRRRFLMTRAELRNALENDRFELALVRSALSSRPSIETWPAERFLRDAASEPIQYCVDLPSIPEQQRPSAIRLRAARRR